MTTRLKGGASCVDGAELLAPTASGTRRMQGTTETATTDAFGVIRAGAYGTKLSSTYEPLRGDAGLEQAQKQVMFQLQKPVKKPIKKPRPDPVDIGRCERQWEICARGCNLTAVGCVTGAYAALLAAMIGCRLIPVPHLRRRCLLLAGSTAAAAIKGCYLAQENCLAGCGFQFEDCINGK